MSNGAYPTLSSLSYLTLPAPPLKALPFNNTGHNWEHNYRWVGYYLAQCAGFGGFVSRIVLQYYLKVQYYLKETAHYDSGGFLRVRYYVTWHIILLHCS